MAKMESTVMIARPVAEVFGRSAVGPGKAVTTGWNNAQIDGPIRLSAGGGFYFRIERRNAGDVGDGPGAGLAFITGSTELGLAI